MGNDTVIGIIYTAMGLFGIIENAITAYFIATDPHMRHPTYLYIINLSICDVVILFPISLYAGLTLLWPALAHPIALKIGAYLVAIGWYPGCIFMLLASISRYVQLAQGHNIPKIFSRRNMSITISLAWFVPAVLYTCFVYYDPAPFTFFSDRYTWGFNREEKFGNILSIVNISVNSVFAILINAFNLKSLMCVHKLRRQVQMVESAGNMKREIKLFAQCAITGTIYTAAVIYYFVVSALEDSLVWYEFLTTHLLWVSNHLQNPIIYLILNNRLRRRLLHQLCSKRMVTFQASSAVPASFRKTIRHVDGVENGSRRESKV